MDANKQNRTSFVNLKTGNAETFATYVWEEMTSKNIMAWRGVLDLIGLNCSRQTSHCVNALSLVRAGNFVLPQQTPAPTGTLQHDMLPCVVLEKVNSRESTVPALLRNSEIERAPYISHVALQSSVCSQIKHGSFYCNQTGRKSDSKDTADYEPREYINANVCSTAPFDTAFD
jgi:hypothetical protein